MKRTPLFVTTIATLACGVAFSATATITQTPSSNTATPQVAMACRDFRRDYDRFEQTTQWALPPIEITASQVQEVTDDGSKAPEPLPSSTEPERRPASRRGGFLGRLSRMGDRSTSDNTASAPPDGPERFLLSAESTTSPQPIKIKGTRYTLAPGVHLVFTRVARRPKFFNQVEAIFMLDGAERVGPVTTMVFSKRRDSLSDIAHELYNDAPNDAYTEKMPISLSPENFAKVTAAGQVELQLKDVQKRVRITFTKPQLAALGRFVTCLPFGAKASTKGDGQ